MRRVVITGLGAVSPIGNDIEELWDSVKNGKNGIAPITRFDTTGFKIKLAGELKGFDPEKYVEEHGLKTVNDEGALREIAAQVIAANPKAVEDYKGGKEKALGALVGQIMKAMKGKANPGMVNQMLRDMLK